MTPLYGHTSEETAYLVEDYPYGFRLRCQMKVWLEYKPSKGFRMVTRTSNPKKPGHWNKPVLSTYCAVAGNLYLDEKNHVHWAGLVGWEDQAKLEKFWLDFPGTHPESLELIKKLIDRHNLKKAPAPIF